jgi:hypothetical protein
MAASTRVGSQIFRKKPIPNQMAHPNPNCGSRVKFRLLLTTRLISSGISIVHFQRIQWKLTNGGQNKSSQGSGTNAKIKIYTAMEWVLNKPLALCQS